MENIIGNIVAGSILAGMWFAVACVFGALAWGVKEAFK